MTGFTILCDACHHGQLPSLGEIDPVSLQEDALIRFRRRRIRNPLEAYDAIADEILRLRDQRRQAEVDSVIKDEKMKQIRDLQDFVKGQPATITEFDETLVSRLIEKITVFEDRFTVDFKSGITIDIEA